MKSYILLHNAEFYAYHGVGDQEQIVGNVFIVDLKLKVDISAAVESDELADTVSYADVYDIVNTEMKVSSRLLEHLAGRIVKKIRNKYSQVEKVDIKVLKRNPPVSGQVEFGGVHLVG